MPTAIYLIWDNDLSKLADGFCVHTNYDLVKMKVDAMNKDMIDSEGWEGDRWVVAEYVLNTN